MLRPYDTREVARVAAASVMERSDPAYAGQAVYTRGTLRAYDTVVTRLSNSWVWRCPARRIREHYERHLAASHLDVGPGSGYFLDRCRFPVQQPRVALLDPNPDALEYAGHRIRRYGPTLHVADVLKPVRLEPASFGSVALNHVLHCLPGDLDHKLVALDHLMPLVKPGGVVFGATVLHGGVQHTALSRNLLRAYNRRRIFCNLEDDLAGLERGLAHRFDRLRLQIVGSVVMFAGWVPTTTTPTHRKELTW